MTLVARHAAVTDIGLRRKTNEDAYVVAPPLYAVCDGMGGAQAGEVASTLAAETLAREVAAGTSLLQAAEAANAAVYERAGRNVEQTGMGTTLTALLLEGDRARLAHIGDSRAYLLRGGELRQLTDDHSLVGEMQREGRITPEEAAVHPHRSVLSRALGTESYAQVDESGVDLQDDDVLLLCSDGLSGVVGDEEIRILLGQPDLRDVVRALVDAACGLGGPDNITAVVVRLEDDHGAVEREQAEAELEELETETAIVSGGAGGEAPPAPRLRPAQAVVPGASRRARRRLLVTAVVLALVVLLAMSAAVVMSLFYFVGVDDGRLVMYSGLPVSVGPLSLHVTYRKSSVTYDSLNPMARQVVDARQVGTRDQVLSLAVDLGMWP